jgi:predicted transposase YbfD/YdcC
MIKLYLVTGFLGAGKTTFLKNFVTLFDNDRIALIINEFGKEGIDGKLLSPLNVDISEINNGSIFCACGLEQFEQTLKEIIKNEPEAIIIEASGLSDPTSIRNILSNKEYDHIQYRRAEVNGKKTEERAYHLGSVKTAEEYARGVRMHWGIESTHWSLDVTFREDASRTRRGCAPQNLALLKRLVLNMVKKDKEKYPKKSLKRRRFMASLYD